MEQLLQKNFIRFGIFGGFVGVMMGEFYVKSTDFLVG